MKIMRKILLLLLLCPVLLYSQLPPPIPNTYVHDYAGVLTAEQTEALNAQIKSIDTANKIKFAIVLINLLPGNYTIEDYAREIGNKWQVGKGVIYVAAIDQHKQRLEVSSHLEGIIPDATALHITDHIKPFFRQKDYYGGLAGMVTEIDALLKADAALSTQPKVKVKSKGRDEVFVITIGLIIAFAVTLFFILYYEWRKNKKFKERIRQEKEIREAERRVESSRLNAAKKSTYTPPAQERDSYTPPPIIYTPPASSNDDSSSRSRNNDNNYGGYDSGSSSDSYSGGGASNDW